MLLKNGYNFDDNFEEDYTIIDDAGESEISVRIDNVITENARSGGYGAIVHLKDGKIVAFTIKSYDIELTIPATIEMHNKIQKIL